MKKLDLKKEFKHLYMPSAKEDSLVEVPAFNFAMVDGGMPAGVLPDKSEEYLQALEAIYGISYGLKFKSKLREVDPIDYTVMALEGLWWVGSGEFEFGKQEDWFFTSMMMQPDHITEEMFLEVLEEIKEKKPNPALEKVRFERFHEGLSVQIMHIGPYSEEPRSLDKIQAYIEEHGYRYRGDHHEIYIGNPLRAKPENLKTVLRHPVEKIP